MMKIDIDKKLLKKDKVDISTLISQIMTGRGILFTGAGFSKEAINTEGRSPPLAEELAAEICHAGQFDPDNDLRYVADYYLANKDKESLISLLKRKFSLSDVSEKHINICKINWRRFYTTNYDKCIEIAANKSGKLIESIDINYPTNEYYQRGELCIHLNGSIDCLTTDSLENSFKLSTSSYISADSFINSPWFYYFKKDLERSSVVVFIGYSMYDVEIQKILFENDTFREKIYFITEENPDHKTAFTLSKFGKIVPIGVKGFSEAISTYANNFTHNNSEYCLQALSLYRLSDETKEIRDSNVEKMLLYGDIENAYIDNGVSGTQRFPYLVVRDEITRILEFIRNGENTIIYSDLGNGKSIILREIKTHFTINSIEVYDITDWEGDYIGDFDELSKSKKAIVIIIDGYERHLDLMKHYSSILPDNINFIASARTSEHERLRSELKRINFSYNEINVDTLSEEEVSEFIDIIDNIGIWRDKASFSHERKKEFLVQKNSSQISLSLLALFDAPQIKDRVTSLIVNVIEDKKCKDTIFSIALIEILNLKPKLSLVSEVAGNNNIYSSLLRDNKDFNQLFKISDIEVLSKSSLFCLYLIRNYFLASYITDQFLKIAKHFSSNVYTSRDFEQDRIFKSMLKFSFVERLLPDTNKRGTLKRYYEDLKISVPWLKNDPHFWLQYGMANITFNEYQRAQDFIDQAYALAEKRNNYQTNYIDAQQARLFILMAVTTNPSGDSNIYEKFEKAHRLLSKLDNDVYKFRQVGNYKDFYEICYIRLTKSQKVKFYDACIKMLRDMEFAEEKRDIDGTKHKIIRKAKDNLLSITAEINQKVKS